MKTSKQILGVLIALLLGISLMVGGCGYQAQKPANPGSYQAQKPATPVPPQSTIPAPAAPQPTQMDVSKQAVAEASKVNGVKKATAIVSDNNIYIGLELNSNLKTMKPATIEKSVIDQVKLMQPGYNVMVTSDKKTVSKIKTVAQGIAQGKSIAMFSNEMKQIMTMMPKK